jgi:hypothetical protein
MAATPSTHMGGAAARIDFAHNPILLRLDRIALTLTLKSVITLCVAAAQLRRRRAVTGGSERTPMAKYATLNEAMVAKDELAEAELRYRLLAEAFESLPQLRSNLNPQIERCKAEIVRLRAQESMPGVVNSPESGTVVAFDATRFRKSG